MNQGIELQTELGANAQDILLRGEAIPEEVSAKVLLDKISSPEVAHHGECNDWVCTLVKVAHTAGAYPSFCSGWSWLDRLLESTCTDYNNNKLFK